MAVDLDAVLAGRSPEALREATLGGRTIKFRPLTIGVVSRLSSGKVAEAMAELIEDEAQRSLLDGLPVTAIDDVLSAVFGDLLGK